MSLFQLNTPAFPASRLAMLVIGVVGLVALNVIAVLVPGGLVHHYDVGLRWLLTGAAVTLIGIPLALFGATLLWHWVAGTTALNGPGRIFALAVAMLGPCLLAAVALYAVAIGKYVGAHIPPQVQGIAFGLLAAIVLMGVLSCVTEIRNSINKRRSTA